MKQTLGLNEHMIKHMQANNNVGRTVYCRSHHQLSFVITPRLQHMWGAVLVRLNDKAEQIIRDKSSFSIWLNPASLSNELLMGAAEHMNVSSNIITFNGN